VTLYPNEHVMAAVRTLLPMLGELLGDDADQVERELRQLLVRAEAGESVESEILAVFAVREPTRVWASGFLANIGASKGVEEHALDGYGADTGAEPDGGAATANEIRRTPHLKTPKGALAPGQRFTVHVWADTAPPEADEESEEIVVTAAEPVSVAVKVVTSAHFDSTGRQQVKTLVLDPTRESTERRSFSLRVIDDPPTDVPAFISALFWKDAQRCGRVTRHVELAIPTPAPAPVPLPSVVAYARDHADPDLAISIDAASPTEQASFDCTVTTPHLPAFEHGATGPWRIGPVARDVVVDLMKQFMHPSNTPEQRANRLRGAGIKLFEASPQIFQQAYWELIKANKSVETISIVSQEPYVPWELMVPERGDGVDREPLGIAHAVGRWTTSQGTSAPQRLTLSDSYALAPKYRTLTNLAFASAEAEWVCDHFHGRLIDPGTYEMLDEAFTGGGATILHFVCHGGSGGASLMLAAKDKKSPEGSITVIDLAGWKAARAALQAKHPLVFLNACEVGRQAPALHGIDGLVPEFARLGASCVIAPVWSVDDKVAHDVAERFYEGLIEQRPLASILQEIRRKAYDPAGADSYAAYCFFGDPLAVAAIA
jgi:CHAT domain